MHRSLALTLALASALAVPASSQQFTNDTSFPAQSIWTDGVETVDVDGDGDIDILFANGSAYGSTGTAGALDQHLFLNDGAGNFTAAHGQLDHGGNFNAKLVIAEDFDNDGDPDLLYCSGSAGHGPRLLLNDGAGNFSNNSGNLPATPTLRSFGVAAGDIDNDGDLDVAITDGGTFGGIAVQQRLWTNNGSAVFTDVTSTQMPVDTFNCQDVTFLDYDGDWDVDLLLSGKGGTGKRGRIYVNDGAGNFSVASAMNNVGTGSTYEVDWSDLDGDGDYDGNVQSVSGVSEGFARNNGGNPNTPMTTAAYPAPNGGDDNEMAQLDYDNDGDHDCFAGSLASSGEKVWRNNGGLSFINDNAAIQTITDSTLDLGFADVNGDGRYDMITGQGESGNFTNKLYLNSGPVDTLAPVIHGTNAPGSIGASSTVIHVRVSDAVSDDGHINADVTFAYTSNVGSGSGTATRMGLGQFRIAVPSAGATSLTVDITATDHAGISSVSQVNLGGVSPWADVGGGKAGTGAIVPVLTGTGPLTAGSPNSVDLTNAVQSTTTNVVLGLSLLNLPFKGGTLVPSADIIFFGLPVSGGGTNSLPFVWPAGIPNGTLFWVQHWVSDAGATFGFSASNGLRGTAQ